MRRHPVVFAVSALAIASASAVASASGTNGALDPSFGVGGIVTGNITTLHPSFLDEVEPQPDGKVIVAGTVDSSEGRWTTVVQRLLPDGALDPTFGEDGTVALDLIPDQYEYTDDMVIGAGGEIYLLTGYREDAAILGLDSDGSRLPGFGVDGIARFDVEDEEFTTMAVAGDGSLIVAGRINVGDGTTSPYYSMSVRRITAAGALDSGFGTAGLAQLDLAASSAAVDVVVFASGAILVVGNTQSGAGSEWSTVLLKLTAAGARDTSFDSDGYAEPDLGGSSIEDRAAAAHPFSGETFVVAVTLENANGGDDLAVARFQSNGAIDGTFGSSGVASHGPAPGTREYTAETIDLLANSTIIVAGQYSVPMQPESATASMVAFTGAAGTPITGFGLAGADAGIPAAAARDASVYLDIAVSGTGSAERITAVGAAGDLIGLSALPGPVLVRFDTAGIADNGFGTGGVVDRPLSDGMGAPEVLVAALELPDGRIIAVGYEIGEASYVTRLSMHRADGSLDTTWGSDGYVLDDGIPLATSAILDAEGRLLVVGFDGSPAVVIRRYLADGSVDTTFGTAGIAERPATFTQVGAEAYPAVVLDSRGRILVGSGLLSSGQNADMLVYRLTADGVLDATFGTAGAAIVDIGTFDGVTGLAIDGDGRIVAVGYTFSSPNPTEYVVMRLADDGALDPTFGTAGIISGGIPGADSAFASSVAVDDTGRPVVGMLLEVNTDYSFGVIRLRVDGTIDTSFTETAIPSEIEEGYFPTLVLRPDGHIVVIAYTQADGAFVPTGTELHMLNPDGSPDTTFGAAGVLPIDDVLVSSVRSVSRGDLLAAGALTVFDFDMDRTIVRVLGELAIVPAAPAAPSLVAGDGTITATWTEPVDDGAPRPTGYTVTLSPGGSTCTTTGALTCEITGLANGTDYTATVRAANRIGTGPESAVSAAVSPVAPTAPTSTTSTTSTTTTMPAPAVLPETGRSGNAGVVLVLLALGSLAVLVGRRQAAR